MKPEDFGLGEPKPDLPPHVTMSVEEQQATAIAITNAYRSKKREHGKIVMEKR